MNDNLPVSGTKKYLVSGFVVVTFVLYAMFLKRNGTPSDLPVISGNQQNNQIASSTVNQNPTAGSNPPQDTQDTVSEDDSPRGVPSNQNTNTAAPAKTTTTPPPAKTTTPAPVKITTPTPAPKPQGQYKDGTYTGSVVDVYYGNFQVAAVISGGKLTNVNVLQHPNDRSTSIEIYQQAAPYLLQEAIAAQSAKIDIVSGATEDSLGYQKSLASALAQAKN